MDMVIKKNARKLAFSCKSISFSSETLHSVASLLAKVLSSCEKLFFYSLP